MFWMNAWPPDHHRRGPITFESSHWSKPGFEATVVALDAIIGVLLGVVKRVRDQLLDQRLQRLREIGDYLVGCAVSGQRTGEELASCGDVTRARDVHVDDLAVLVHCPVDVTPFPATLM